MKSIVVLNLTPKQGFEDKDTAGDQESDVQDSMFVCPIAGLEMNGKYKFYYIRRCGCVMSERAIKEVKTEVKTCLLCNKPYEEDDLILLNGSDEEVEDLRNRMILRQQKAKEEKGERKRKRGKQSDSEEQKSHKEQKVVDTQMPSTSKSTASNSNVKASSLSVLQNKAAKDYSVSKDPTASEAYKSLFTTHESAKNKEKAHWVTFNPCYN